MAALNIETGVETHPEISIVRVDLEDERVIFRWIGGPYSGDCNEPFAISLAEHGDKTLNELAQMVSDHMVGLLTEEVSEDE